MAATDKTVIKLKENSTAVIASSAYADTLPEELTKAGLTLIDTYDPGFLALVKNHMEILRQGNYITLDGVVLEFAALLRSTYDRKLNIGKVLGKKPKKVRV